MQSLKCHVCNLAFDKGDRRKLLYPCFHSACRECYLKLSQPQEGTVKCPFDNEIFKFDINNLPVDRDYL